MSVTLAIPDLHTPFHHKDAIHFLDAVKSFCKPDLFVLMGDEVDYHNLSFHDTDPDIPFSASSELDKAIIYLQDFYKLFPRVTVLESNHGSLVYRKAKFHGIPRAVIKPYNEILEAPKGWLWKESAIIDGVKYKHSFAKNLKEAVLSEGMNIAQGHFHTDFEIRYFKRGSELLWGATVGCLIDYDLMAFNYAKTNIAKPIEGCFVNDNGLPILIPMKLDKHNRWTGKL